MRPQVPSSSLLVDALRLGENEVHIWFKDLKKGSIDVSTQERQRARRFRFERDASAWLRCRSALRWLLAAYLDIEPRQVPLLEPHGTKPAVGQPYAWLEFNVSHSHALGAFAVSRTSVGIDIEAVRQDFNPLDLGWQAFSELELKFLRDCSPQQRLEACFHLWTRKESVLKAVGKGLSIEPSSLSVLKKGDSVESLPLQVELLGEEWFVNDIQAPLSHAAAFASRLVDPEVFIRFF